VVTGPAGARWIAWDEGPTVEEYSRHDQVSQDPERANQAGWNCRTHVEYEGSAAVDWYIPEGTPLIATMDGTATLYVNTVANAFDYYGVDPEPYLGDPDRARAPRGPFPGPGGGMGVFVRIANEGFVVDYGHLDISATLTIVPGEAFLGTFSAAYGFGEAYRVPRDFRQADAVARWAVEQGDVVGYSGDAGYSEAPHLHYVVRRQGGPALCPTDEAGFDDGGWLWR
jgi:murein DD-endopeptidase MepM/ murein hydrolase activator NlpD